MNKNLASNLLSQGSIEQEYLSKNEVFAKNKKFSTESAKLQNQQFITCCSSLHYILPKMTNNKHLRWEISTTVFTLL